ncbi:MAG: potassium channel family protein [Pseudomonadota bacterium]
MSLLTQLGLGTMMVFLTVLLQAAMVNFAYAFALPLARRGGQDFRHGVQTLVIAVVTLWMMAALSLAVWVWAGLFLWRGAFADLETALYFSAATFTTLGYGDVLLDRPIRVLSGILAANGLIMFGLSTAFLIDFVDRFGHVYQESERRGTARDADLRPPE